MSSDPEHEAADLVATEGNKPMSAAKLAAVIPGMATRGSRDRDATSFAASRLAGWDARSAGEHSVQRSGGDKLTARECDVLAMISQGLSNKHIARALEISPETVKSHVKRIFLKLTVSTRAEAVSRAGSFGLFPTASHDKVDTSVAIGIGAQSRLSDKA